VIWEQARRDRATELWRRTAADAIRVAFVMGAGPQEAQRTAIRAFRRASWMWMDHRDPYWFETWVLRFTIKSVARRERVSRLLGGLLRRPRHDEAVPLSQDAHAWRQFRKLPWRHRAVVVLVHLESLSLGAVADVLQTSAVGARALHERALGELDAAGDAGQELTALLRRRGAVVRPPDRHQTQLQRTYALANIVGALTAGVVALAFGAATIGVWTALPATSGRTDVDPRGTVDEQGGRHAPAIPTSELLGAPDWCPSQSGMLPLRTDNGVEAVGVATRLNLGLINGYRSSVAHLVERPRGAPDPYSWSTTTGDAGQRVVLSVPAEANSLLASRCGHLVARRTWEVILEDPGPPHGDGVAFYLLRRADGMNVWGTFAGIAP
jgi:DNA-directed RNA polymerase specialized sigma24 family protein